MIHQLIYASAATIEWSPGALLDLLHLARRHNGEVGISGMLAHNGGTFLQFLEGPAGEVEATLRRIEGDRRHTELAVLLRREVEHRWFPDWSMGFEELDQVIPGPGIRAFVPPAGPVAMWVADPGAALDFFDRCRPSRASAA